MAKKKKNASIYPELVGRTIKRKTILHQPDGVCKEFENEYKIGFIKGSRFEGCSFVDIIAEGSYVCEDTFIEHKFDKFIRDGKFTDDIEDEEDCRSCTFSYELI